MTNFVQINYNIMAPRKFRYPIGIQTFSEIREGGYMYVDKTGYEEWVIA